MPEVAQMQPEVSVVVSTFNRCEILRETLESLMTQDNGGTQYEVIVVDNNSTDRTRSVVEALRSRGHSNLQYCYERTQGVSHARNKGIALSRGSLIAFTDDDIKPTQNWISSVRKAFQTFPDAHCIGGRVLPQSATEFPVWLTPAHWTPLALLDLGDDLICLDVLNGPGLVGANLAVRASVFNDVGDFSPLLQRVNDSIGSMEDHDFLLKLGRARKQIMYIPEMVVHAHIFPERLTKSYHRRWHLGHGYFYALMRAEDFEASKAKLLDIPAHVYRRALSNFYLWMKYRFKNRPDLEFHYESELRFFVGFMRQRLAERKADWNSDPTKG
jgi:glucosyl-dolichyl phosphate glucuronosyltransferase